MVLISSKGILEIVTAGDFCVLPDNKKSLSSVKFISFEEEIEEPIAERVQSEPFPRKGIYKSILIFFSLDFSLDFLFKI